MLRLSHALRREWQQAPKTMPRAFHQHRFALSTRAQGDRCAEPLPQFDPDFAVQPQARQPPEFRPRVPMANEAAARTGTPPPYRAGDGEAAILVRLQGRVLVTLEGDGLRIHTGADVLPGSCCSLPGMAFTRSDAGASGTPERSPALGPQYVPGVLLEEFWSSLPACMSEQGRSLFEHFNDGLPIPTTAAQCNGRLQAYAEWLGKLSD